MQRSINASRTSCRAASNSSRVSVIWRRRMEVRTFPIASMAASPLSIRRARSALAFSYPCSTRRRRSEDSMRSETRRTNNLLFFDIVSS